MVVLSVLDNQARVFVYILQYIEFRLMFVNAEFGIYIGNETYL